MTKSNKIKVVFLLLLLVSNSFPYNTDSLGIDDEPILNIHEYEYIRDLLKRRKLLKDSDSLNIKHKYIFITGSSGQIHLFKKDFFKNCVIPWIKKKHDPVLYIVHLTKAEKLKSGGYDAIICGWTKSFSNYSKKRAIRKNTKLIKSQEKIIHEFQ